MIYAEDLPYWRSGDKTSLDNWLTKASEIIERLGGSVMLRAMGRLGDQAAYILLCEIGGERYRIAFPILPTRTKTKEAQKWAERQAVTMLYHDVKARSVSAAVLGTRAAFITFLQLPDGRTVSETTNRELLNLTSNLFSLPSGADEIIEGEIV